MSAKKKSASDAKTNSIRFNVADAVLREINELAERYGYEDNRSKYIELAARGLLVVDRGKLTSDNKK